MVLPPYNKLQFKIEIIKTNKKTKSFKISLNLTKLERDVNKESIYLDRCIVVI